MKEATRGRSVFLGIVEVLLVSATDSRARRKVARLRKSAKIIFQTGARVTSEAVRMDNSVLASANGSWRLAFGEWQSGSCIGEGAFAKERLGPCSRNDARETARATAGETPALRLPGPAPQSGA
ncbi:MAG: hypothetical protein ACRD24_07840, partial [Terriglobales bacterium]